MKMKKLTSVALAAALAIGTFGFSVPAKATEPTTTTTDYVLTIPATLSVANAGWNTTDGIKADNSSNNFDTGKKLTVTATSEHGWKLAADGITDTVGYNLAASGDDSSKYSGTAEPASWEFSEAELNAENVAKKDMGIIVEDYSNKAAGNYQDTVTFTASVEDAAPVLTYIEVGKKYSSADLDNVRFYYIPGETYRQAVQNHGTENGSNWKFGEWSTTNHTIYYGNGDGNLYIDGDDAFAPGRGSCELTLDSVVDPDRTYTHNITIYN